MRILFFFFLLSAPSFAQLPDRTIYDLKSGRIPDDTSYVYELPYAQGKRFLLVQASNSQMSHKGELALDFKMKKGNKICAVRSGVVLNTYGESNEGGLKPEYLSKGNFIIIEHNDGSVAKYWHLGYQGVLVKKGDTIQKGQHIGFSGNTGYSAFPHLHFELEDKNGKQILCRFQTKRGKIYLRPARRYRRI